MLLCLLYTPVFILVVVLMYGVSFKEPLHRFRELLAANDIWLVYTASSSFHSGIISAPEMLF